MLRVAAESRSLFRLAVTSLFSAATPVTDWEEEGDPLVLLHGFCGTPRMLRPLGRFLRRRRARPILGVPLGIGLGDIRDAALRVAAILDERSVARCDVVGYSRGGLVGSYLVKCLDQGRRVRRMVTLGTPHGGAPLVSGWAGAFARLYTSAAQMKVGSPFLEQLRRLPPPAGTRMLSIAGAEDPLVPPRYARITGRACSNRVVAGVDHWGLLTSRRVFRCVERALALPDEAARTPAAAAADAHPFAWGTELALDASRWSDS